MFEYFCEKNMLTLLVDILTGLALSPEALLSGVMTTTASSSTPSPLPTFLPPVNVAIQVIQTVSILIQNVKKVTSLYYLLSNNYVNELIDFSTSKYRDDLELTTHFISFLKSLAMRMNSETVQFFVSYPPPVSKPSRGVSSAPPSSITFPMYSRALSFLSSNEEFVRLSAFNVCLNTLQLARSPSLPDRDKLAIAVFACSPSNASELISPVCLNLARHTAAIKDQILNNFQVVEEGKDGRVTDNPFQDVGGKGKGKGERGDEGASSSPSKTTRSQLMTKSESILSSLQDELILLDDVLRVGLTSLNEQILETVLATYVYPLLLEPLLLCVRHPKDKSSELGSSHFLEDEDEKEKTAQEADTKSARIFGAFSDADLQNSSPRDRWVLLSPARTSLIALGLCFVSITNRPLLRFLTAALFHPLSPDAKADQVPRAIEPIAYVNVEGEDHPKIRIDITPKASRKVKKSHDDKSDLPPPPHPGNKPYSFGSQQSIPANPSKRSPPSSPSTSCIFVLAPLLAQILDGDLSCTKANPYRRVMLSCLRRGASSQFQVSLQSAAVFAIDSAVSNLTLRARPVLEECLIVPRRRSEASAKALEALMNEGEDDDGVLLIGEKKPKGESKGDFKALFGHSHEDEGGILLREERSVSGASDQLGEGDSLSLTERRESETTGTVETGFYNRNDKFNSTIASLAAALITNPSKSTLLFNKVCAHALTSVVAGDKSAISTCISYSLHYLKKAQSFMMSATEGDDGMLWRAFAFLDPIQEFARGGEGTGPMAPYFAAQHSVSGNATKVVDLECMKISARSVAQLDSMISYLKNEMSCLPSMANSAFSDGEGAIVHMVGPSLGALLGSTATESLEGEEFLELAGMVAHPCVVSTKALPTAEQAQLFPLDFLSSSAVVRDDGGAYWLSIYLVIYEEEGELANRKTIILAAPAGGGTGRVLLRCGDLGRTQIVKNEASIITLMTAESAGQPPNLFGEGGQIRVNFEDEQSAERCKTDLECAIADYHLMLGRALRAGLQEAVLEEWGVL